MIKSLRINNMPAIMGTVKELVDDCILIPSPDHNPKQVLAICYDGSAFEIPDDLVDNIMATYNSGATVLMKEEGDLDGKAITKYQC